MPRIGPCLCGDTECPQCGPIQQGKEPNYEEDRDWMFEEMVEFSGKWGFDKLLDVLIFMLEQEEYNDFNPKLAQLLREEQN